MESKELYRHLLGMNEPWTVERVELDMERQQVDVYVGHAGGTRFACPECGWELAVYDHSGERTWRHLDSCQFLTYLHASPPRVSCPEHGVRQARLPWAEEGSRFTHLFEALALNCWQNLRVPKPCDCRMRSRDDLLMVANDSAAVVMLGVNRNIRFYTNN